MFTTHFPIEEIIRFIITMLRVSGIILFAPLFSSLSIPTLIRAAIAFAITLVLAPALPMSAIPSTITLGNIAGLMLSEGMAGVILGFAGACVFAGMEFAGQMISFQLGFALINVIDPQTQVEVSVFSFIQNYIGLLIFLMLNGHHWFLLAISESFKCLPVGGAHLSTPVLQSLLLLTGQIFSIGLRIAGPIIAISLILDVVMGMLGRAAPQVSIMIIGMPLKLLVGFACLSFSFYFLPRYFDNLFYFLYRTLFSLIQLMAK
jgi:flagellar biosynthesis protein FliR